MSNSLHEKAGVKCSFSLFLVVQPLRESLAASVAILLSALEFANPRAASTRAVRAPSSAARDRITVRWACASALDVGRDSISADRCGPAGPASWRPAIILATTLTDQPHVPRMGYDHFVPQLPQLPADPGGMRTGFQGHSAAWDRTEQLVHLFFVVGTLRSKITSPASSRTQ